MRRNLEASHYLFFSQRVLLALVESGLVARRRVPARAAQRDARVGRGARLPRARARRRRDRVAASTSTPSSTSTRTRATSTPIFARLHVTRRQGGTRSCLRPRTSRPERCASSTRSTTTACCSSRATASRPSTSSSRPRSPTRDACSPASPASGSRCCARSSRTTCSRSATTARSMECRQLEMLPIECVVRGYLAGSGWKDYQATGSTSGHALPEGLRESDRLPEPIFTPATKAQIGPRREHHAATRRPSSSAPERFAEVERVAIELYRLAAEHALDARDHHRRHEVRARRRREGHARARRRGADARLVALLAGRHVRAGPRRRTASTSSSCATTASDRDWDKTAPGPGAAGRRRRATRARSTSRRSSG